MGKIISKLFESKETKILMLGLDNSGKTTLIHKMKFGEMIRSVPTVGFNMEAVTYKKTNLNIWDLAGQKCVRLLWRNYFHATQG